VTLQELIATVPPEPWKQTLQSIELALFVEQEPAVAHQLLDQFFAAHLVTYDQWLNMPVHSLPGITLRKASELRKLGFSTIRALISEPEVLAKFYSGILRTPPPPRPVQKRGVRDRRRKRGLQLTT